MLIILNIFNHSLFFCTFQYPKEHGTIYWMDVSDASYYMQDNNEIKVAK